MQRLTMHVFKVLPMVPMVNQYRSRFYQWYHWYPLALQLIPLVSQWYHWLANGTIGYQWNGTIGEITNGTIGRNPNRAYYIFQDPLTALQSIIFRHPSTTQEEGRVLFAESHFKGTPTYGYMRESTLERNLTAVAYVGDTLIREDP